MPGLEPVPAVVEVGSSAGAAVVVEIKVECMYILSLVVVVLLCFVERLVHPKSFAVPGWDCSAPWERSMAGLLVGVEGHRPILSFSSLLWCGPACRAGSGRSCGFHVLWQMVGSSCVCPGHTLAPSHTQCGPVFVVSLLLLATFRNRVHLLLNLSFEILVVLAALRISLLQP